MSADCGCYDTGDSSDTANNPADNGDPLDEVVRRRLCRCQRPYAVIGSSSALIGRALIGKRPIAVVEGAREARPAIVSAELEFRCSIIRKSPGAPFCPAQRVGIGIECVAKDVLLIQRDLNRVLG